MVSSGLQPRLLAAIKARTAHHSMRSSVGSTDACANLSLLPPSTQLPNPLALQPVPHAQQVSPRLSRRAGRCITIPLWRGGTLSKNRTTCGTWLQWRRQTRRRPGRHCAVILAWRGGVVWQGGRGLCGVTATLFSRSRQMPV